MHTGAKILNLSKNSHFQNLIFHKIHIFNISFFTKFTFSKSHFSQNSHYSNIKFQGILDKKLGSAPVWNINDQNLAKYTENCVSVSRVMCHQSVLELLDPCLVSLFSTLYPLFLPSVVLKVVRATFCVYSLVGYCKRGH